MQQKRLPLKAQSAPACSYGKNEALQSASSLNGSILPEGISARIKAAGEERSRSCGRDGRRRSWPKFIRPFGLA
jgi:hypothetical protein